MNRILNEHQQRNLDSRGGWECYSGHRRRVTEILLRSRANVDDRLCVLGAGNCNDLDLSELTEAFAEVHLVDLDAKAIQHGMDSQEVTDPARIHVQTGIDLAGGNAIFSNWTPNHLPADADVEACIESVAQYPKPELPGPFHVVASVCLLTQLFDSIAISLGGEHPRFLELITTLRLRHIRLLFELLEPGGAAILITDFVSSGTYAPLATTAEEDLPGVAARLIESRNFFTGANPAVLHSLFKTDPVVAPRVGQLDVSRPWLWNFGPRTYAVCAINARSK